MQKILVILKVIFFDFSKSFLFENSYPAKFNINYPFENFVIDLIMFNFISKDI